MSTPDPKLPFFDYGLFMPGQLGFHRIREFVGPKGVGEATIHGQLLIRDGLPILELAEKGRTVPGRLVRFDEEKAFQAYGRIYQPRDSFQ